MDQRQSIRFRCLTPGLSAATSSSRSSLPVQSFSPSSYRRYWLGDPALPLAISSAVRFSGRRAWRPHLRRSLEPLFGFRAPPEYYPADPSRSATADQHLSWAFVPFSTQGPGCPLFAGLPHPLRSALRVWLPSRRLAPSEPVPVLFHTGGAHGIRPSELPPPARYPRVSARKDPRTVFPAVVTVAETTGRPGRPRFLGFDPCESPWRSDAGLVCRTLAAPLGFTLLRPSGRSLGRVHARHPLTRFCRRARKRVASAPEFRSVPAWPRESLAASRGDSTGQPF
jgi:hypothetical protein